MSVFTVLYGYLSGCVYIAQSGTMNTKSCSCLNYGWYIYTDWPPRAPSFVFAVEKQNRAKQRHRREWLNEEESRGGDSDKESKPEIKLSDWQQAAHTNLRMDSNALCLCSYASCSSTEMKWYDLNSSFGVLQSKSMRRLCVALSSMSPVTCETNILVSTSMQRWDMDQKNLTQRKR